MISIKFFLVISMLRKTEWSWELRTWSHTMNLLDISSTSPHYFCRKWTEATKENSNFDLRVYRVKEAVSRLGSSLIVYSTILRLYSLWKLTNILWMTKLWFCQTNIPPPIKHYFKRYKQQKWTLKNCNVKKFSKTTVSIRLNLLQVYPSVNPFVFAVLLIPFFNILSGYCHVWLNSVTVPTVWILINFVTQLL